MVSSTDLTGLLQTVAIGVIVYQIITSVDPAPLVDACTEDGKVRFHLTQVQGRLRRLIAPQSIVHFAAQTGMLFPKSKAFSLNGLRFPIDVVFLDASSKVVDIIRPEAGTKTQARCKDGSSLFIVNRGEADGLKKGDLVQLHAAKSGLTQKKDAFRKNGGHG